MGPFHEVSALCRFVKQPQEKLSYHLLKAVTLRIAFVVRRWDCAAYYYIVECAVVGLVVKLTAVYMAFDV